MITSAIKNFSIRTAISLLSLIVAIVMTMETKLDLNKSVSSNVNSAEEIINGFIQSAEKELEQGNGEVAGE